MLRLTSEDRHERAASEERGYLFMAAGACSDCPDCPDVDDEYGEEPGFSMQQCELCGSHFGGDRYAAHGIIDDDDRTIVHYDVCCDCLMYLANGEPYPDETDEN
jgi:hypothetical protein